jgi:hypothetical protein
MYAADYFRYTTIGHLIRVSTGGRILPHAKIALEDNATVVEHTISPVSEEDKTENENGQTNKDTYLVDWTGQDDPMNPKNFAMPAKILIGIQVWPVPRICSRIKLRDCHSKIGLLTFIVTISSSVYSGAVPDIIAQFECSAAVASLGLSLFVIGIGLGPLVSAGPEYLRHANIPSSGARPQRSLASEGI